MNPTVRRQLWRLGVLAAVMALLAALYTQRYDDLRGTVVGSTAQSRVEPCLPGRPVPVMDSPHISRSEAAGVRYNSSPATSGPHFPFTVEPGYYSTPVPPGLYVHAMEHGHVVIHYAPDTPEDVVDDLVALTRKHLDTVVLTPRPSLRHGLALTAWGRIERLDGYDRTRIETFIDALAGRYDHGWARRAQCPDPGGS